MESPSRGSRILSWITLGVALIVLLGGLWLLISYWRGAGGEQIVPISPDAVAKLNNQGGGGGGGPPMPAVPTFFSKGGSISSPNRGMWRVAFNPYQMIVRINGAGTFDYRFMIQEKVAFSGADAQLMNLATEIATNPATASLAGVSTDEAQKIRRMLGFRTNYESLESDAASVATCSALWEKYMAAGTGPDHEALGAQLLDAVVAGCKASLSGSASDLSATVAETRKMISPEQEAAYRSKIDIAKRERAAKIAAERAATRASAATRPASSRPTTKATTRP